MRIFVSSYSIRVRKKWTEDWLPLDFETDSSLYRTFYRTMAAFQQEPHRDSDSQRLLRVRRFRSDSTDIWGLLDRGEFGISARGVNNETYRRTYDRSVDDAEVFPLYFRFHLPPSANFGILILQRLGVHGAVGHLNRMLQEEFRRSHENHMLKIGRFVPLRMLDALRRGAVREVSVFMHNIPRDIADRMRLGGVETDVGVVEIRVRARRKGALWDRVPYWMSRLDTNRESLAEVFGSDVRKVRVRLKYGDQERSYVFANQERLAPYIDITDDIEVQNGHPAFRSIDKYSLNLRDELIGQLGREHLNVQAAP